MCVANYGIRGFGKVYKALDQKTSTPVAIKKINNSTSMGSVEIQSDKLKACTSKYIVKYYNLIEDGGSYWVMCWYCFT